MTIPGRISLLTIGLLSLTGTLVSAATIHGTVTSLPIVLGNKKQMTIEISVIPTPANYPLTGEFWGGVDNSSPNFIITGIRVYEGRQKRAVAFSNPIPISAYADLSEPATAAVKQDGSDGFLLIIAGSDAGGAYTATFKFKSGELEQRTVRSDEFPDDAWEQTKYTFNHMNN